MSEELRLLSAYLVAGGILMGFIALVVLVTIGFRYVRRIEERVSTSTGSIAGVSQIYSDGLIGRLVRSSHVFAYLVFRNCSSSFCYRRASMLGDPEAPLPKSWQAWCLIPALLLYGIIAGVLVVGAVAKLY
ncbi:hypothetical protein [Marinobacter sp. CHS3-4]|uniref:hypothetical protein n=1 Tax=Marinobacter sp. CHS3-4 TaxID=3045174 RepID=UPI0024B53BB1|nr:hypothetical protein [Marinobacter sp. CHS3-4]MDI9244536.1 hypothetical protein [Marinobacter sp. CHS3-4]